LPPRSDERPWAEVGYGVAASAVSVGGVLAFYSPVDGVHGLRIRPIPARGGAWYSARLGRGLSYRSRAAALRVLLLGLLWRERRRGDLNKVTIMEGASEGLGSRLRTAGMVKQLSLGTDRAHRAAMQVGERSRWEGRGGEVRGSASARTTVKTGEGADVIVPDASLVAEKVTQGTASRTCGAVDVGRSAWPTHPPEKVLELLRSGRRHTTRARQNQQPRRYSGFADTRSSSSPGVDGSPTGGYDQERPERCRRREAADAGMEITFRSARVAAAARP